LATLPGVRDWGDLNTATPEQPTKLGVDEGTANNVAAVRPFSSLDDAKLKEAVPADVLAKLQGKVTVKPPSK
jgi:DNA uptake protein ComE-like DNA-binding protein